jgi:hypothetical protein
MRRISPAVALVAVFFCLSAVSAAAAGSHQVKPLRLVLSDGHTARACTRRIPASWSVAVWVHASGTNLWTGRSNNSSVEYYAGHGTMVRVHLYTGDAPICIQAITWLRRAHISVGFRVLSS